MARFDVHVNRNEGSAFTLLLDVQADFLEDLQSRVVIPLSRATPQLRRRARLNIDVEIDGRAYMLQTELLGSVRASQLGERVASLQPRRDEIVAAIDFLLQGF